MVFKKGNVPWIKGKHHTKESKQKLREKALKQFENGVPEETKRKISESLKGGHHTEETRKKISKAQLGKKNHRYGKHHTKEAKRKISLAGIGRPGPWKGKHFTEKHRQNIGLARKGHVVTEETRSKMSKAQLGEKNHNYGMHHTEESKYKLRLANLGNLGPWKGKQFTEKHRQNIGLAGIGRPGYWKGKHFTEDHKQKIRSSHMDWDFYNEHGCLKRNYPYNDCFTEEFKNMIRERDGNKCVVTGMTNEEHKAKYGVSLHIHHWTYDKDETNPFYFVTVTCEINIAAGTNRRDWINMFNGMMEDKYCEEIDNWIST